MVGAVRVLVLRYSGYSSGVFGDECRQQVSVRRVRVRREFEEFEDRRRTKDEVVTESQQTGGEPVQSHGLWGDKKKTKVLIHYPSELVLMKTEK